MRYYIIFGVTVILALIIIFYHPYLGSYKDNVTIEQDHILEGYEWTYDSDNDVLVLSNNEENKWIFKSNHNGVTNITFYFKNDEETKYEIHYKFRVFHNRIFWLEGEGKGLFDFKNPY